MRNRVNAGRVSLIGLAYKGFPEIDDTRASPASKVFQYVQREMPNASFSLYDPLVKRFMGMKVEAKIEDAFMGSNVVCFLTNHLRLRKVPLDRITAVAGSPLLVIDAWRNTTGTSKDEVQVLRIGNIRSDY